jgi:selenocysteine-specific elongation factor
VVTLPCERRRVNLLATQVLEPPLLTIGIAGHVDHGKTSLVRALTGIETDRLPEEQRRGISIELGFAHLEVPLPGGQTTRVGIIDMPGHERFVRRMISGAAGLDAVLLVVAADEGVMPQGREHLAICRLLGVQRGAVVLTKVDLVDPFLRDLVAEDLSSLTDGTFLQGAPVWPVSVKEPATIEALRAHLGVLAADLLRVQAEHAQGLTTRPFRMAIDRSFTHRGRGTVVAGTAATGQVAVEDLVQILPGGATFRVRSLEQHGKSVATMQAPGRVALNLAAATLEEAPIGAVLVTPDSLATTSRFDALLHLLAAQPPLGPRRRAMLHIGTTQVEATVVQLSGLEQEPGTDAFVQLHLDAPLAVAPGEPFVLRGSHVDPRFGQTLAGGRVLHGAPRRHRLGDEALLATLADLAGPRLDTQIHAAVAMADTRGETEASLIRLLPAPPAAIARGLKGLLADNKLRRAGTPPRHYTPQAMTRLETQLLSLVKRFHASQDARPGIEPDQLHRDLGTWLDPTATAQVVAGLVKRGLLEVRGPVLAEPGFRARAVASDQSVDTVASALEAHGLQVPTPAQLAEEVGLDPREVAVALQAGVAQGRIVRLAEDHYCGRQAVLAAVDRVIAAFVEREGFTTGELKDLLGLTRKHLIPFAEHLDAARVTVRDPSGNRRVRDRVREAWLQRGTTDPQ